MRDPRLPQPLYRRPLVLAAVAALAVVVVLVAVFVAIQGSGDDAPSAQRPNQPTSTRPSSGSDGCGPPSSGATTLAKAPPTEWKIVGEVAVPASKGAGPKVSSPVARCFSHDPSGALFALANFWGPMSSPDVDKPDLISTRAVRDSGYADALALGKRLGSSAPQGEAATPQIVGFRMADYSNSRSTFAIAWRMSAGKSASLFTTTYTVSWSGNDWKIVYPDASNFVTSELDSLDGYIKWSAT